MQVARSDGSSLFASSRDALPPRTRARLLRALTGDRRIVWERIAAEGLPVRNRAGRVVARVVRRRRGRK